MNNNNEICLAGEVTEILADKPRLKKFILKSKGFEIICTAIQCEGVSITDIKLGLKCYVQGNVKARRWTRPNGYEALENQFTVTKIV